MTEISFYHLERQPLAEVLPKLLEKALASGFKVVVLCGSAERVAALDSLLWTYDPDSFLPHGRAETGHAERQPVYLTTREENPNQARVLIVTDGATPAFVTEFDRCLDLFDGNDPAALEDARTRWRHYREAGFALTYWQQTARGGWEKKA